jgi:Pyridoxamine 5'-phosphate oxidase
MNPPPRTKPQRRQDTIDRLETDVDVWVATADPETGIPHLIPLSYLWDGMHLILSTPDRSPTARNLRATGRARLGLGPTRDLTLIEGQVAGVIPAAEAPASLADAFAARTGFDPRRQSEDHPYILIAPQRIQAWREANELTGRQLMREGQWL